MDSAVTVWMMTRVELANALARRRRETPHPATMWEEIDRKVLTATGEWDEVIDAAAVRERAMSLVPVHALRAADLLQLGAAIVAADDDPASLEFVTLDRRLADAARREGFSVLIA